MVTAGYINKKPLLDLCKLIDAANIDLKGFTEKYYEDICSGTLKPVLNTIEIMYKEGVMVEITNLIIPTLNDDFYEIEKMCKWIRKTLNEDVPLHFSRFYPMYKLKSLPLTPKETLVKAREIALNTGLNNVYVGNIPGTIGENTYCPKCKKVLIGRMGYSIRENNILDGNCKYCNHKVYGIWQ